MASLAEQISAARSSNQPTSPLAQEIGSFRSQGAIAAPSYGQSAAIDSSPGPSPVTPQLNPWEGLVSAGVGLGDQALQPFKDVGSKLASQFKYLTGPTATGAQRQSILTNQIHAARNPQYVSLIKSYNGSLPADATKTADQMVASGAKLADVRSYLDKQQQAYKDQLVRGAGDAAQIASYAMGGPEAESLFQGGKVGITAGLKMLGIGALGGEGSALSSDPQASVRDQIVAAGTGGALGLGMFGASAFLGKGAGFLRDLRINGLVGKEAQSLLDKVGSAKNLADLYNTAIEARSTGARALTKDEQNVISLVENQRMNFGGGANEAFQALANGDTKTLRTAFDTRSGADRFVSGLLDKINSGTYDKLKYSQVGQQIRTALGDSMTPVYDAINRSDASFAEKKMLRDMVDFGSGNVKRGVAAKELLSAEPVKQLTEDLHTKGFQNKKLYDDVSQYITARHENVLMDNKVKPENASLRSKNDAIISRYTPDQQKVLEGKYQNLKDVFSKWLDIKRNEGVISPEEHAALSKNPDYIRVQRELESGAPEQITRGSGKNMSLTQHGLIQKTGKSQNKMIDPIAVMYQRAQEAGQVIDKNRAAKEVLPQLESLGIGQKLPDTKTVSSAAHYTQNVAGYLDEGMPKRLELPTNVAEAVKNQHVESLGKIQQLFGGPTRLFKTLTTSINPSFGGPNVFRDVQDALAYSRTSGVGTSKFMKGMGDSLADSFKELAGLKTSKAFEDYSRSEGGSAFVDLQAKKGIRQVRNEVINNSRAESGNPIRVIQSRVFNSPLQGLRTFSEMSEQYTRYASYKSALDAAKANGMSDAAAHRQAILAARNNSIDFYKGGTAVSPLNTFIPYLNPGIQGARKFAQTMRENPVSFTTKIMTQAGMPAILSTMWNLHDENTRKIYMDIPESEKSSNFLFVIPGMSKDGRSRYSVVKIPMPYGMSSFVQPLRRAIEAAAGVNSPNYAQMATDILSPFSGVSLDPNQAISQTVLGYPIIKGAAQYMSNKDFYFNKDIVPGSLQNAPAPEQFDKGTSNLAKEIGAATNTSPMKLEQLARDTLGGGAPILFNTADQIQSHIQPGSPAPSGKSVPQAIADRFMSAQGGEVERQFYNVYGPTSGLRDYRQNQINKLLHSGDGAKIRQAQRMADEYNREVDQRFSQYFHQYGAYAPKQLSNGANPMDMISNLKIDVQTSHKGKVYVKR